MPEALFEAGIDEYEDLLDQRRKLIAAALRTYYGTL
jgi:hypothetical protein